MTEAFIRDMAAFYGLSVAKRITAGTATRHFATFELTGPIERTAAAWDALRQESRGPDFDYRRRSDADGAPYIGLESVWCDVAPE